MWANIENLEDLAKTRVLPFPERSKLVNPALTMEGRTSRPVRSCDCPWHQRRSPLPTPGLFQFETSVNFVQDRGLPGCDRHLESHMAEGMPVMRQELPYFFWKRAFPWTRNCLAIPEIFLKKSNSESQIWGDPHDLASSHTAQRLTFQTLSSLVTSPRTYS